jgi:hypothetical protein
MNQSSVVIVRRRRLLKSAPDHQLVGPARPERSESTRFFADAIVSRRVIACRVDKRRAAGLGRLAMAVRPQFERCFVAGIATRVTGQNQPGRFESSTEMPSGTTYTATAGRPSSDAADFLRNQA